jgi:hypothetical protein
MYESRLMRVLAARDGSGAVPLYEGRMPGSEALILTTCKDALEGCSEVVEFAPGDFKYELPPLCMFCPAAAAVHA